jgi:hypothetical protein
MSEDRLEKDLTLQIANSLKIILNVKESPKQRLEAFLLLDNSIRQLSPEIARKLYEKLRVTLEQLLQDRSNITH